MPEISKPTDNTFWIVHNADKTVFHTGETNPDQVTTTGQPTLTSHANEIALLGEIQTNHILVVADMPPAGSPLLAGEIYKIGANAYQVRQDHNRTADSPDIVPALFFRYRLDADENEWVEGEWVAVGDNRTLGGAKYRCIQAHQTQSGWEPAGAPALWEVAPAPAGQWQAGQAYSAGHVVSYLSLDYVCIQPHTSQLGWEPAITPALWDLAL